MQYLDKSEQPFFFYSMNNVWFWYLLKNIWIRVAFCQNQSHESFVLPWFIPNKGWWSTTVVGACSTISWSVHLYSFVQSLDSFVLLVQLTKISFGNLPINADQDPKKPYETSSVTTTLSGFSHRYAHLCSFPYWDLSLIINRVWEAQSQFKIFWCWRSPAKYSPLPHDVPTSAFPALQCSSSAFSFPPHFLFLSAVVFLGGGAWGITPCNSVSSHRLSEHLLS